MATLFPVGSIVKLKDEDFNTVIIGYGGANVEEKVFDYIGLPSPMGMIDKNAIRLFDDAQIEQFVYMGYLDAATQAYIAKVEEAGKNELPVFKGND